jgi:hypothetical protein
MDGEGRQLRDPCCDVGSESRVGTAKSEGGCGGFNLKPEVLCPSAARAGARGRRWPPVCPEAAQYLRLLALALREQDGVDVGQDAAGRDGHAAEELVELLVVADGQLHVPGDDAGLLVVAGGVAGELKDLGTEVLEDRGQVDRSAGSNALGGAPQEAVDASDRELKPGLGRAGLGCSLLGRLATSSLSFARHCF